MLTHKHAHTRTSARAHTRTHTYTHAYTHGYAHMHVHMYNKHTHTHTRTYTRMLMHKGGSWPRRDSPSVRLAEPWRASFPVWKTLVGQRGCQLFGRNQPHLPRNPQKFPNPNPGQDKLFAILFPSFSFHYHINRLFIQIILMQHFKMRRNEPKWPFWGQ